MQSIEDTTPASLTAVLERVVDQMQRASRAQIVTLYLYDAESQSYFAPTAIGLPDSNLAGALSDMQDQLSRYLADAGQGKAPDELQPQQYGPNVWLTIRRRPLVARDAPAQIDSSFIRRHRIQSVVGLPLLAGDNLVGILYLDFVAPVTQPDQSADQDVALEDRIPALEQLASRAAFEIDQAQRAEDRQAFVTTTHLATHLATPWTDKAVGAGRLGDRLDDALRHLLEVTRFDAALVYQLAAGPGRLDLVTAAGLTDVPRNLVVDEALRDPSTSVLPWNVEADHRLQRALAQAGMYVVSALPLRTVTQPGGSPPDQATAAVTGCLLLLSTDRLAALRRTPATRMLLESAAELLAGALAGQRLILTLEDANRVLAALGRLSGMTLRPGASRQQVLDAVVRHLIDAQVPEFDFQFASIFLLSESAGPNEHDMTFTVRMAAGAASAESIDATPLPTDNRPRPGSVRVPRWVQVPDRALADDDVLVFAVSHWQSVVIGPSAGASRLQSPEDLVTGYPQEQLRPVAVPAVRADGSVSASVPAVLIGPTQSASPSSPASTATDGLEGSPPPFTLDGEIFDASGHGDLVRVFVPFGLDLQVRATGVLEAGYHRAHKRQLERTQVEALRAATSQVAVAVETARLYEEARRHADQLEIIADISKAMASSIDLDQTLRLVARNFARSVDASLCQIALFEEDGSAWYGAAASDEEALWRRQRGERPEPSIIFSVLDRRQPIIVEDAQNDADVNPYYARLFGLQSLLALPLIARDQPIGVVVLAQRDRKRRFTPEEAQQAEGLAHQAAVAIQNARMYALAEEERHIQKDLILVGFGQWGQKAYGHLVTLKQFFNFKTHVVEQDLPGRREALAEKAKQVIEHEDAFYWDSPELPARDQLKRDLESSCYVITYIATPAATHLPVLAQYYDLSNVVVVEKPLGAPAEAYRSFLDSVDPGVEIVAADHYFFKLEVRLLQLLLTEERTLKSFLDSVEEIEVELLEEQPLSGSAAKIGIIEDMLPHAFVIISLFTPIDRIELAKEAPLLIGRQEPLQSERETYARLTATFLHQGRPVRLIIDMGKGVESSKWIKLSGEKRLGGRRAFYKFDFGKGIAIDGTQTNLRAAVREIRQPGVPDNAHLTMLRHVVEKRHPAVGILAIREAMRSNQRIQEFSALAGDLLARGQWTPYRQGQRPDLPGAPAPRPMDKTSASDMVARAGG